ncbi:glycosyltransferase family 4 protein [Blastococcus sp. TML/M2B]|uniref:glycosyltransferase family 4 protein n=1 Tax=unclassified Blastococcus TaxID=2619396 RepID=UPI00190B2B3A|nr:MULTISPECIES: glycosyltransferase family 1 protein [unclassified Blastococcus]MBN1093814.1 glycosyltransferase family 4 protein [Blastococcus sp. TML/M2B]MBN1096063.1 glycosyltransferase family 4 protein [Blastococcus sp. TML/C7B]
MRIGLDATPLLGPRTGVGRYTGELVRALAAAPGDEVVATAFTFRGTDRLRELLPPSVEVRARRMPARVLRELWRHAEVPPVSWSTGRVDLFHATNFVLPPVGRATGVVTVHDLSFLRTRDAVDAASLAYRDLVPRSIDRAAVVVTPSRAVADEVVAEYGTDPARVLATPLGVSPTWLGTERPDAAWLAARGLPADYVVAVGTLEPRKGLQTLVDAFDQVLRADPTAPHLVLVGPEGWGAALDLSRLPAGTVHLTGFLDDEELRRVVAGSRGLAFPSRYEGFGLPPLEALACGRPVVVSDLPVMREVLGGHGRYVPVGDVDALAEALAALPLEEPGEVAAARREHAATFSWATCADRTRAAYALARSAG